jgi:hypothetical protein
MQPILWIHGDCLSPGHPAFERYPGHPALWVWDDVLLDEWQISLKRIIFLYECLLELPVEIRRGDPATQILAFASEHAADTVITSESPGPRFRAICAALQPTLTVQILPVEAFILYNGQLDLKRFSRYWQVAEPYALGQAPLQLE